LHQEPFEGDLGIQFEFRDSVNQKVREKVLAGKGEVISRPKEAANIRTPLPHPLRPAPGFGIKYLK